MIIYIITVIRTKGLRARVDFFEADIYDAEFLGIDWYHSLLPKKPFGRVIWDLGHFLVSLIWPVT